jgi:hypothetical protein
MLRKNPGCFTNWQLRQLEKIDSRLGKLDRETHGILRSAKDLKLNCRQWRQVGEVLGTIALRFTFALRCRQEILAAGRRQRYSKIIVRLGTHCYPDEQSPTPHEDDNEIQDDEDDKNFQSQVRVRALLELANLIEEFSEHSTLRGVALGVFFRQLNRLKTALLKHLIDLEGRIQTPMTKIEVDLGDKPIDDEEDEPIGDDDSQE